MAIPFVAPLNYSTYNMGVSLIFYQKLIDIKSGLYIFVEKRGESKVRKEKVVYIEIVKNINHRTC